MTLLLTEIYFNRLYRNRFRSYLIDDFGTHGLPNVPQLHFHLTAQEVSLFTRTSNLGDNNLTADQRTRRREPQQGRGH